MFQMFKTTYGDEVSLNVTLIESIERDDHSGSSENTRVTLMSKTEFPLCGTPKEIAAVVRYRLIEDGLITEGSVCKS